MSELRKLPNIGKEVERQLEAVGISTYEQLNRTGAYGAWLLIQGIDPSACIHRLMALEGAIRGVKKAELSDETKRELRAFYQAHKVIL